MSALLRPLLAQEARSEAQVREHYLVEVELADRLREASAEERPALYSEVYDELFRRVPHHQQLTRKESDEDRNARTEQQLSLLMPYLDSSKRLLEIGAGDCALSIGAGPHCRQVTAVDVSSVVTEHEHWPDNVEFRQTEGTAIPVTPGSVDVAFSDQLMEHLHPEDAQAQLGNIHTALRDGGCYICVTPNQVAGPWDISMYYDETARGLHLREYRVGEFHDMFLAAGFSRVEYLAGGRGFYRKVPKALIELTEKFLLLLPYGIRSRLALTLPVRGLLGIRAVGWK